MNDSMRILVLILIGTIIGSIGAVLLKKGSAKFRVKFSIQNIKVMLTNYYLIAGFSMYAISTVLFLMALKLGELSVVYPLTSITYIFISILSVKYLGERMNIYKWAGIGFIILGVLLVKF